MAGHVSQINTNGLLTNTEKEFLLTIDAIVFNSPMWNTAPSTKRFTKYSSPREECTLFGGGQSGGASGSTCIVAGAITGGIVGYTVCGLPCAIGGAVIGGVLGAINS